jgi:glycosyltransferase 2 family protein
MRKWAPLLWLSIAGVAAWALFDRLRAVQFREILAQLQAQPLSAVLIALACCAGVYALVGVYEGIAVHMASGRRMFMVPLRTALIANPLGRAIGFAVLSAGALRYRLYSAAGLSLPRVATVIVIVAMPYFFAVGWLIDLSLLFNAHIASTALHLSTSTVITLGAIGLAKDVGWLVLVAVRSRPIVLRGWSVTLPSLRQALTQIAFGLVQISLMAGILYSFMPAELGMAWPHFIGIYCIAFTAGQLSNIPVGLGVLEAALLLMLPQVPPGKLIGAVLAYRAVYELLPLLVALALLLFYEVAHPQGIARRRPDSR